MKSKFFSLLSQSWNLFFFKNSTTNSSIFFSSKLSKWKFTIISYVFITLMFCPYFKHMVSDYIEFEEYAFYYIVFSMSIFNLFIFSNFVTLKDYKVDLLLNLLSFFLKNTTLIISLVWVKISKFVFFYFHKFNTNSYVYNFTKSFISNKFIMWRPLFKRMSYFGNYKLTRSKFNNLNN